MKNTDYTQSHGSEWHKWDLHFHTPVSFDYKDKEVTPAKIIETLKRNGIKVVGITDHHLIDKDYINKLKEIAGNDITILPGVEIRTSGGGAENIHLIGIFKEDANIQKIQEDINSKEGISQQKEENRPDDQIYVDLNIAFDIIRKNHGISIIHSGKKANGLDVETTNGLPYGMALKKDISKNVDIFEVKKTSDAAYYKKEIFKQIHPRPIIRSSDNHDIKYYDASCVTWIKADLSFEGLKQVLYEPEERISFDEPVQKASYNVIESVTINSPDIFNQKICFSPNLNTIIGGRSSGKSLLLASIAKHSNIDNKSKNDDLPFAVEYEKLTSSLAEKMQINWADLTDSQTSDLREIEYFRQDYMYSYTKEASKRNDFIKSLIQWDISSQSYNDDILIIRNALSQKVNQFFTAKELLNERKRRLKEKGDDLGISNEINKLEAEKLNIKTDQSLTEDELQEYNKIRGTILSIKLQCDEISSDIENIPLLKNLSINDNNILVDRFSREASDKITKTLSSILSNAKKEWETFISNFKDELNEQKETLTKRISVLCKENIYVKGVDFFKKNSELSKLDEKINAERDKLKTITNEKSVIQAQETQIKDLFDEIISLNMEYYTKSKELINSITIEHEDLKIVPIINIKNKELNEFLTSFLNQRNAVQSELSNRDLNNSFSKYEELIKEIAQYVYKENLTFKTGNDIRSFFSKLVGENFFSVDFQIEYDGDNFETMSEGKKAFVMLKMLLEFSKKSCPILIDQPEDDLDNRAIYTELVTYLKDKKKERQIILVTHNPNVVIATDSELVIVANQHGIKNKNPDNKKFAYISGPIENRKEKDKSNSFTLESQGIREHICEILEGGIEAFRKREKRYFIETPNIETWDSIIYS